MRILNLEQFSKEPEGTVYCEYIKHAFDGELSIKYKTISKNKWYTIQMIPREVDFLEIEKWDSDNSYNVKTELFCCDDSCYEDRLFAVFEKPEIETMIYALSSTLETKENFKRRFNEV